MHLHIDVVAKTRSPVEISFPTLLETFFAIVGEKDRQNSLEKHNFHQEHAKASLTMHFIMFLMPEKSLLVRCLMLSGEKAEKRKGGSDRLIPQKT